MANKKEIIKAFKNNEVVIFPTDTVWGIGALYSQENSIKVAKIKGNLLDKKYTVMFKDKYQALRHWKENEFLTNIVKKHFPGDLTIIAPTKNEDEFLGIRIPDDKVLLSIIKEVGPIIATSANLSGKPPLNSKKDLKAIFKNIKILDGVPGGKSPSTIIKVVNDNITIIRQGDKVL